VPPTVSVPGTLAVSATLVAGAPEATVTGFVSLHQATVTRRIPFWFRVSSPVLATEKVVLLTAPGDRRGSTVGKPSRVRSYRYPEGAQVRSPSGPEQAFRYVLRKPVANFGVAVTGGAHIEPFVVSAGNEDRLTGYAGLPLNINPYLESFGQPRPVSGAIRPAPGAYDLVFDTPSGVAPGAFTFRFWVNDVTPPSVRLPRATVSPGSHLDLIVTDTGSGVDPQSLVARIDGKPAAVAYSAGRARVGLRNVVAGRHRLTLIAADYQELKNMENVPRILPNTRTFSATFRIA
jgi:hypothetical protein